MVMMPNLYQTNTLQLDCIVLAHCYPDSEPTSSSSLTLGAQHRSNKYQFNSLRFDLTGTRTMICRTRGEHANIAPPMRFILKRVYLLKVEVEIIVCIERCKFNCHTNATTTTPYVCEIEAHLVNHARLAVFNKVQVLR